jgi:hypothetical protein
LSWNGRAGRWRGWRWTPRAKLCILPGPWQWELWNVDGEEGKARSEEARKRGGEGEARRRQTSEQCTVQTVQTVSLCHCADNAVYLALSEDGLPRLPCPRPAKNAIRYISETLCCAGPHSNPHRVGKPLEHSSFNIQYCPAKPKSEGYYCTT